MTDHNEISKNLNDFWHSFFPSQIFSYAVVFKQHCHTYLKPFDTLRLSIHAHVDKV